MDVHLCIGVGQAAKGRSGIFGLRAHRRLGVYEQDGRQRQTKCLWRVIMARGSNINSANKAAQGRRATCQQQSKDKTASQHINPHKQKETNTNPIQTWYMTPPPTRPRCSQPGAAPCTMSAERDDAALTAHATPTAVAISRRRKRERARRSVDRQAHVVEERARRSLGARRSIAASSL